MFSLFKGSFPRDPTTDPGASETGSGPQVPILVHPDESTGSGGEVPGRPESRYIGEYKDYKCG